MQRVCCGLCVLCIFVLSVRSFVQISHKRMKIRLHVIRVIIIVRFIFNVDAQASVQIFDFSGHLTAWKWEKFNLDGSDGLDSY